MWLLSMPLHSLPGVSRSTVAACWTADQQVKPSILHLGHDSYQNSFHYSRLSPAPYNLTVQNCGLKYHSFHFIFHSHYYTLIYSQDPLRLLCPTCIYKHIMDMNLFISVLHNIPPHVVLALTPAYCYEWGLGPSYSFIAVHSKYLECAEVLQTLI